MDSSYEATLRTEVSRAIDKNIALLKTVFFAAINTDAQFRPFHAFGRQLYIVYMEGMADDRKISDFVLRACAETSLPDDVPVDASSLILRVVEIAQCETEQRIEALVKAIVAGKSAVLIDGCDEAILLETRGYPSRQVNATVNESAVIGSQEGFVESLRTNMTLLRRYVQTPALITESVSVGACVSCQAVIAYVKDIADEAVVAEARNRLKRIHAHSVQGLGAIQQLIEDSAWALLPQALQTERPDRAASCLMEGQVAILADNSPYALIVPVTLFHQLHASDDSFSRWQYGSFLRIIRVLGMLVSVFLPGLYIALTDYHMHILPLSLLGAISEARANVPFPILVEILIMEFSFYLINEAGTRMPRQIGSALGIVGALILGQAAVSASIISPILIIIVAITGLGNYAVPDYGFSLGLILCRLFVIACGALLGLYGICLASVCLAVSLCAMTSLGFPYVAPIAPSRPHNPDILLRLPLWLQRRRLYFANPQRRGCKP